MHVTTQARDRQHVDDNPAPLSLARFFQVLSQTPRDWFLTDEKAIRRYAPAYPLWDPICPVQAVLEELDWQQSVLPQETADRLASDDFEALYLAADGMPGHDPQLRKLLLQNTGLEGTC